MTKTVDAATMRQINKKYVVEMIYNQGPLSRIDISQLTGLNKATVSSLVDDLIANQYVNEIGYGVSSGGRKPVILQFNAKAGYCIGLDLQITHIKTVLTDLSGEIVYKRIRPVSRQDGAFVQKELEWILCEEIEHAAQQAPPSPHGLIGAGIALPGIVNFKTGSAFYLPNIELKEWGVSAVLSQRFSFPIFVDNDGNCGAWAERRKRQSGDLVFINAGIGIGTGIVVGGQLHRGRHGIAGEFSHMTISAIGVPCACGNYGCWEQYASEQALLRYLREEADVPHNLELSPNFVSFAVQEASAKPAFKRAFGKLGHYLGIGIANIVNALNPESVVIGGTIAAGAEFFMPDLQAVVRHRSMDQNKQIEITIADEDTIVLGAAGLPITNTILQSPLAVV